MLKKIIASAALLAVAASSYAAEPGFYAGADIGSTKINQFPSQRASFGVLGGYNFTDNFAVEANYRRLRAGDNFGGDVKIDQKAISAIGTLPLNNGFSVFGRLGYNRLEAKDYSLRGEHEGVLYGIGAKYDFGNKISTRLEVQRPTSSSTNLSASVLYAF
jgi:OOP family OmpA-OmpF porin